MTQGNSEYDLLRSLNHIERFHRRRMVLIIHLVLSLGIQFAIWANWYASYMVRGIGFEGTFFADRLIISVVLTMFLIGHYLSVRLMESKDWLVVKTIQEYDTADDLIENPIEMKQEKKKKQTTRELLFGSGLLVLFSPLILSALYGAGIGLIVLTSLLLIGETPVPDLGLVVLIYGILFAIILFALVKFSARFSVLIERLINIFREHHRYRNAVVDSPAAIDLNDDVIHQYIADQQAARERTDYR